MCGIPQQKNGEAGHIWLRVCRIVRGVATCKTIREKKNV